MTSTPSSPKLPFQAFSYFLENSTYEMQKDAIRAYARDYAKASIQAQEAEIAALREDAERQREEDREILAAVVRELGEGSDGNAPGHAHSLPGIWDWDNGEKAGKACSWCLCWTKFTELAARAAQEAKG